MALDFFDFYFLRCDHGFDYALEEPPLDFTDGLVLLHTITNTLLDFKDEAIFVSPIAVNTCFDDRGRIRQTDCNADELAFSVITMALSSLGISFLMVIQLFSLSDQH